MSFNPATDFNPGDTYNKMLATGDAYAEAAYQANRLEEMKKIVLAQLTEKHLETGGSKAAAEVKALADKEYETFIEGMCVAREKADKARVRWEAAKELSSNRRTQVVNNREQSRA